QCREGSTVVDMGAHIGLYTVLMSRYVGSGGRVVALEPTPSTRQVLDRTLSLNFCSNVEVRTEAAWKSGGDAVLWDSLDPASNRNGLFGEIGSPLPVQTISVDDLGL